MQLHLYFGILGIFVSFYCLSFFKLFLCVNLAYRLQELDITHLLTIFNKSTVRAKRHSVEYTAVANLSLFINAR